jgi:hypothetical protein
MSYFMRYISTDATPITLAQLEQGLQAVNPTYRVVDSVLHLGDEVYGDIEINYPSDELFADEIAELQEAVRDAHGKQKRVVLNVLQQATTIIAVQVLYQNREIETTLQALDPLWTWLFTNRQGLLQVDGEGYYAGTKLLLKVED